MPVAVVARPPPAAAAQMMEPPPLVGGESPPLVQISIPIQRERYLHTIDLPLLPFKSVSVVFVCFICVSLWLPLLLAASMKSRH